MLSIKDKYGWTGFRNIKLKLCGVTRNTNEISEKIESNNKINSEKIRGR